MLPFHVQTSHEKYTEAPSHWHSRSQKFAGGDQLLTAIRLGWQIAEQTIFAEQHWLSGTRPITVYNIVLSRADETIIMPVIANPYVERFIVTNLLSTVYEVEAEKVMNR